ncbi:MAG: Do family serine endopeptidase [Hyphomicrobiaceae bacterium]|nr:Do family serine endopeptidase [Hyphomicrobiaceae bacterium]
MIRLPRRVRVPLIAAFAGASALALAAISPSVPVHAQLKAEGTGIQMPGRAPLTFADVVERVKPAVVSINVVNGNARVASGERRQGPRGLPEGFPDLPEDHPLHDFFKNLPREFRGTPNPGQGMRPMPRPRQATGSGFVITADGFVVTNNHVIDDASKVTVTFDEQHKYEADVVGTDPRTDLALLKINAPDKTFPYVKFASGPPRVGDWVLAVGNPFGLGGTVTAGIVSALARDIGSGPYDFMQIDAAVNRGNSGGPTFNLDGEVVGVNTAIYSPSGGNVGIAFAVPASTATEVVAQLQKNGSVSRGWLGVRIQTIDEDTAASLGLAEPKGALVNDVTPNGPAAAAGLRSQDAILAINGDPISDSRELARKIAELDPKSTVDVKLLRNNQQMNVKVTLGTFPGSREEIARLEQGGATPEMNALGLTLAPAQAQQGAKPEGVQVTEVDPSSDAATKGLKSGDVILQVNSQTVSTPADVDSAVKAARGLGRKAVLLSVRSGDQKRVVAVQMKG